ncbi:MAG TPA: glycosyltransferase [Rugosimonospora sp.]|nr:glycosyltransferase [Rugosimonospora sp.]
MDRPFDPGDAPAFAVPRRLDVLIPSRDRPTELAATLAGLAAQDAEFGVVVSDQSDRQPVWAHPAVAGMVRILRYRGHPVLLDWHLPRRGLAENRAHLLSRSRAAYVLYADDDVWLEPGSVHRLVTALRELRCGLVGNFPHGLSYVDDHRPGQEAGYREWRGRPVPERIEPRGPQWARAGVHAAANLLHVQRRLGLRDGEWRAYRIAWLGACVLFDRAKLLACGGYDFWDRVPERHSGEDVLVQLRVLARYGGAGILPSGAYHLETPTTVPEREVECFDVVPPHGQLSRVSE